MPTDEHTQVVIIDGEPNADIAYNGYTPMTPDQIREFGNGFGQPNRRADGYRRKDVDPVMMRLADEVSWAQGRIRDLQAQLEAAQLGNEILEGSYRNVDEERLARRMDARLEADRIIADAEKDADRIISDARMDADEILNQAVAEVQQDRPPAVDTVTVIDHVDDDIPDEHETEGQRLQRIARQLPDRLDGWQQDGASIVSDAQMLARAAQDALSRVASTMREIEHALANGDGTAPPALPPA